MLSISSSACEQALANAHKQQCNGLCISIGVSGPSIFEQLEQEGELSGTRPKQRQRRSAQIWIPPDWECTKVPTSSMAFPGGARTGYIELVGFSPQAHKRLVAPNTEQSLGPSPVLSASLFPAVVRGVFHKKMELLNASRARFHWQIWVAETSGKVRSLVLGTESGRAGHELLWRIIFWRWGGSAGIGIILEDKCAFPLICSLFHPVGFSQEDLSACTFVKLKPERENSPFSLC